MFDIVIASDQNYFHLVSVCILSLFSTNPGERIHVHLLSNNIDVKAIENMKTIIDRHHGELSVYPIENLRKKLTIKVPNTIPITSYARLFSGSILPVQIDKILYIDCDIMFNGPIKGLFNLDLKNSLVCGVLDPLISSTYKKEINISVNEPYINAGVLLVSLCHWRREKLEQKFIDFLVANKGNVHHHDQGIINAVCANRKMILPPQFNVMSNSFCYPWKYLHGINNPFYTKEEYDRALTNPIIIHFTGAILGRPWIQGCTHPYNKKYIQYKCETVYKNMPLIPNNLSVLDRLEKWFYQLLPFSIFKLYMQVKYYLAFIKHKVKKY